MNTLSIVRTILDMCVCVCLGISTLFSSSFSSLELIFPLKMPSQVRSYNSSFLILVSSDGFFFAVKEVSLLDPGSVLQLEQVRKLCNAMEYKFYFVECV